MRISLVFFYFLCYNTLIRFSSIIMIFKMRTTMKSTYFGTAAAEGFPAIFCQCDYCKKARLLGGKNIRTRAQALVENELLIDFNADTYWHFLANGIQGDAIPYLLITHSHSDHFYPEELERHQAPFAHEMRSPFLDVYSGKVDQRLKEMGAIHDGTVRIINHFSHNARPIQSVLEKEVEKGGFLVAYDGMQIEFNRKRKIALDIF